MRWKQKRVSCKQGGHALRPAEQSIEADGMWNTTENERWWPAGRMGQP